MSNKNYSARVILAGVIAFCLFISQAREAYAQVTFSRDWNAGKRSLNECSIANSIKTVNGLCQILLNELRTATLCEVRGYLSHRGRDGEIPSEI